MKRSELATLLGISRGMVSRLESRGMPVHSFEAAAAWRKANLNPASRKPLPGPIKPASSQEAAALALARVEAANMRLRDALQLPEVDRSQLQHDLRRAMRAVPRAHRWAVALWCCCWIELLGFDPPIDCSDDGYGDDFAEVLDNSRPWYEIACGEVPA